MCHLFWHVLYHFILISFYSWETGSERSESSPLVTHLQDVTAHFKSVSDSRDFSGLPHHLTSSLYNPWPNTHACVHTRTYSLLMFYRKVQDGRSLSIETNRGELHQGKDKPQICHSAVVDYNQKRVLRGLQVFGKVLSLELGDIYVTLSWVSLCRTL